MSTNLISSVAPKRRQLLKMVLGATAAYAAPSISSFTMSSASANGGVNFCANQSQSFSANQIGYGAFATAELENQTLQVVVRSEFLSPDLEVGVRVIVRWGCLSSRGVRRLQTVQGNAILPVDKFGFARFEQDDFIDFSPTRRCPTGSEPVVLGLTFQNMTLRDSSQGNDCRFDVVPSRLTASYVHKFR